MIVRDDVLIVVVLVFVVVVVLDVVRLMAYYGDDLLRVTFYRLNDATYLTPNILSRCCGP